MTRDTARWFDGEKGFGSLSVDVRDAHVFVRSDAFLGTGLRSLDESERTGSRSRGVWGPQADQDRAPFSSRIGHHSCVRLNTHHGRNPRHEHCAPSARIR